MGRKNPQEEYTAAWMKKFVDFLRAADWYVVYLRLGRLIRVPLSRSRRYFPALCIRPSEAGIQPVMRKQKTACRGLARNRVLSLLKTGLLDSVSHRYGEV